MNTVQRFDVVELSASEQQDVTGGAVGMAAALAVAAVVVVLVVWGATALE